MLTRRTLFRGGVATAVALATGAATANPSAAARPRSGRGPDGAALTEALDQLVAAGATAALGRFEGPGGVWQAASGVARLGHPRAPSPFGRFRIGSITKTFVATTVLQLVGQHRIRLDDTVERWLPGAIPNGDRITVRDLLRHTSGVYNYTDTLFGSIEYYLSIRHRTFSPWELVAIAAAQPPLFEPGTSWSYSNTNYVLLGLIIRRATGNRYAHEVARRVLRPLGLSDTAFPGAVETIAGPHAHGYLPIEQDGQVVPLDITELNPSAAYAAGEAISTTANLNRFFRALLQGRLLKPAQLREMLTTVPEADYGLGIYRLYLPDGTALWGHDGGLPGYLTFSLSTEDASRQLTLSINPWLGDIGPALTNLVLLAFETPASSAAVGARSAFRLPRLDRLP